MARPSVPLFWALVGFFVFRDSMASPLAGKSVLVTGGSGSFGNAFIRRALADGAKRVACYSRGEARQAEMKAQIRDDRTRYFIGDVRDLNRITDACRGVDIVVHAAALKRIETCEEDPNEAIATNITGTQNVLRACIANSVSKAINLSTDKAAAPCTLYGATKITAERLWSGGNVYSAGNRTRFSSTRYGNVCSSTGSVIPLWKSQAASGVITVTDPDATRFWMRIEDAVDLVILALREMRGGETLIPKIGSSTIETLAKAVAPGATMRITGMRPGEKKHELLISEDEARNAHDCGTHYVLEPEMRTWETLPPLAAPKVPVGFQYSSATNPDNLGVESLRRLIA
jgi:UDP-N-acetylglucosamine 4,6-dehydratase